MRNRSRGGVPYNFHIRDQLMIALAPQCKTTEGLFLRVDEIMKERKKRIAEEIAKQAEAEADAAGKNASAARERAEEEKQA